LQQSDAPLSVIAAKVGYTSEFAFANAFKRQYGTPPGKYRRSTQQGRLPDNNRSPGVHNVCSVLCPGSDGA
ncbi:MAG TPA: AraC family transcriptional regulator, partial [Streptosporangiaceae bacterium]